ncbi:MAG: hypothetical protein QME27_02970 [Syntrophaceae bacterium]|nr:hypothetical protein [Syntrophaceae bacterium]
MTWMELFKHLAFWGPGAIIAGLMILAFYRLASKFIEKFVSGFLSIGQDFISAQKDQAASLAKMAQGTEGLRDSINSFVTRDNQEHREMIILLKYTRDEIGQMVERIDEIGTYIQEKKQ